ncbi:MAG TPA: universal stress protein [Schlesneria sp.]|jgi:nucleotide-binding universal stress UspA family protein
MIPRFQHILIPLDFTEKNLEAMNIAFDLAVVNRARVTLLHVVEQISGEADEELAAFYTRLRIRAETELESRSQRFDQVGIVVDCKIRIGRRLHEIVTDSIDRAADLIVMSSHKPDLDRPLQTWATLSYQVSVLCQCPVLLVK